MSDPLLSVNTGQILTQHPMRTQASQWLGRRDTSPVMLIPTIVTPVIATLITVEATRAVAQVTGVHDPHADATDPDRVLGL